MLRSFIPNLSDIEPQLLLVLKQMDTCGPQITQVKTISNQCCWTALIISEVISRNMNTYSWNVGCPYYNLYFSGQWKEEKMLHTYSLNATVIENQLKRLLILDMNLNTHYKEEGNANYNG